MGDLMLTFEDARKKPSDELLPEEQQLIIDNKDKLNDEDREAYASFLPYEPKPDNTDVVSSADSKPDADKPTEDTPVFKSQADIDKYLDEKFKERLEKAATPPAPVKTPEPSKEPVFKSDEKPADWNVVSDRIINATIKAWDEKTARTEAEKEQKKQEAIKAMEGFKGEFNKLASDGKVPSLDTKKGQKMWDCIWKVGNEYGRSNITESFKLWNSLSPEAQNEVAVSLKYKPFTVVETPEQTKQKQKEAQKDAAAKLGHGSTKAVVEKKTIDYKTLHNSKLTDLIEASL